MSRWTEGEIEALSLAYADPGVPLNINALATRFGRLKSNVSRKARELGLTDRRRRKRVDVEAHALRTREQLARDGHPRGALGMKHSPATLAKMSVAIKASWADRTTGHHRPERTKQLSDAMHRRVIAGGLLSGAQMYSRAANGRRPDLGGRYFRSAWEANYARYLEDRLASGALLAWDYEPKTFVFDQVGIGARSYTPDFLVTFADGSREWHEVKGWMDDASRTRLARMAEFYPKEIVVIIDEAWFGEARRSGLAASLPCWEKKKQRERP